MKVAVFYSDSTWASWTLSQGLPGAVRRLGHEVLEGGLPPQSQFTKSQFEALKSKIPTFEQLESCDVILLCGAEYLQDLVMFLYPQWKELKAVKKGWFHESLDRKDRPEFGTVMKYLDEAYLPNYDDAQRQKCKWVPIGVDTEMFRPGGLDFHPIEVGFTGLLYPKRAEFLGRMIPHIGDLEIRFGNIQVLGADCDPHLFWRQTNMLAQNYREMEILLNLPSMSDVLVMKVLEGMAVGTMVVTPQKDYYAKLGLEGCLVQYDEADPKGLCQTLRYYLDHDEERKAIAKKGLEAVREGHRIEQRIADILA